MPTITKFEEIEIWQLAFVLWKQIYSYTQREGFKTDFGLKNQIEDSSGSVMDNIAEGFERGSRNEFVNFLSYSKGSTGEVRSQLYRAEQKKYISKNEFEISYNLAEQIAKKINRLCSYLNNSSFKGEKFKNRKVSEPESEYFNETKHFKDIFNLFVKEKNN